jgi:hypothetical protein
MSREKIKVPGKVYDELVALQREIHFTQDQADIIKKAEDRGYMNAATWIRQNEGAYKIGFAWGFEPDTSEPKTTIKDIPARDEPVQRRTTPQRESTLQPKSSKKSGGFFAGIRNWLGKYF